MHNGDSMVFRIAIAMLATLAHVVVCFKNTIISMCFSRRLQCVFSISYIFTASVVLYPSIYLYSANVSFENDPNDLYVQAILRETNRLMNGNVKSAYAYTTFVHDNSADVLAFYSSVSNFYIFNRRNR